MLESDLQIIEKHLETVVEEHLALIEINAKSINEARERAAKFLIGQSVLSTFLKRFEDDISKSLTLREAQYATGISSVEGKNITEKKANIALYSDYTKAREFNEHLESVKNWIKVHIKIFENAHLMFRQYSKDA